ncbi:piggyBac transposable element-derived protein 4-like [Schistocerca piceifrons]|uniref:piggyBac transposable element-derived protein 4-like n=1 Tax=Schistocerca piceifrons TaxID=274613 RepID=UPI001F5EE0EB|nr:piggyBac transposable element-derived protein 4-like [Schistocerca piceifrons]
MVTHDSQKEDNSRTTYGKCSTARCRDSAGGVIFPSCVAGILDGWQPMISRENVLQISVGGLFRDILTIVLREPLHDLRISNTTIVLERFETLLRQLCKRVDPSQHENPPDIPREVENINDFPQYLTMLKLYTQWMAYENHKFTPSGKIKCPDLSQIFEWVKSAWDSIVQPLVEKSLKKCGVTNSLDATEDDYLQKHGYDNNYSAASDDDESDEDEIDDSLSSDEDENDVEGVASNPAAVPYPKDSEWTAVDTYRPLPVNTTPRQILVDIDESSSVLDCSKVFLTDSDVNELKRQTNLYASQTIQKKRRGNNLKPHSVLSSWKPVTISEMRRFLGIIFHMCVSKKPKIADHWSTNPVLSCNFCPHVMSRLRFTQILSCLHLVDNSNQKKPGEDGFHPLYKVLPYYNNLKERCIQAYRPSEKVTIDEGICPFRGRVSFRVYMQNKPHKYGLKVYAVAEASSGYVVNFEVYAGKHIVDNSSSAVILRLLSDSSLLNKGHTVYLDRFYSSPELFQQLAEKGTGAVGTVNKSRKGLPKDLVSAKLKKGEMSFRRKDNVLAMKWKDKRDVYTLSTRHQATFGTHTKRNGSVVLKPLQVLDYNLNKIGVDIGDQRLQYNPFQHRTVKWWRKLYFHLLLMGVSNAFWLYNAVHRKKITITDFITVLAVQLVEDDTLEFIPRNEGTVGRLTKRHFLQHIPATTKKYAARVCHVCSSRSKKQSGKASRKETRYECEQCGVALCLEPCFKIFHTKKQYDSV